jgi:acetyl-CoA acetyltransferase
MLKEIHLAGSVRTPFGSFCGAFADVSAAELGKAAVGAIRREAGGHQITPRGEHPQRRPPPTRSGRVFVGRGMGIAMALELTSSVGRSGSRIAPPAAPRTKSNNYYEHLPIFVGSDQLFLVCRTS